MSNPFLDHAFTNIVARIELISGVPAARSPVGDLEVIITSGKTAKSNEPPYSDAPHLWLRDRYAKCQTDKHRREVIDDALAELRSLRYAKSAVVDAQTVEGRMKIGRDPRPVTTLMHVYGYSRAHIYRLRKQAQQHRAA